MTSALNHDTRQRCAVVGLGTVSIVAALTFAVSLVPFHPVELPSPPPITVEAGLIELPVPAATLPQVTPQEPRPPEPVQKEPEKLPLLPPKPAKRLPPKPPSEHTHRRAEAPPAAPAPSVPKTEVPPSPHNSTPSVEDGLAGGTGGARAIFQPTPIIPPDLRRHALDLVAVVRFQIGPDGSATAELEEATPDPRLNQVLLDTFRRWRFFPATDHGRPVGATVTLRVPIKVD